MLIFKEIFMRVIILKHSLQEEKMIKEKQFKLMILNTSFLALEELL
mgnify:CR=1 FL=1